MLFRAISVGISHTICCRLSFIRLHIQWFHSSFSFSGNVIFRDSMWNKKSFLGESHYFALEIADKQALYMVDMLIRVNNVSNIFHFNLLLNKYRRDGCYSTVILLYNRMVRSGVSPDTYTYGILMDCVCRSGYVKLGFVIVANMFKRCCHLNTVILNSLIHGLCAKKGVHDAAKLFGKMLSMGCAWDVVTYGILIKCYSITHINLGYGLLSHMMKCGCSPSLVVFNCLLHGLSVRNKIPDTLMLLKNMGYMGCYPNYATFGILIHNYSVNGRVDLGYGFLAVMLKNGYRPNIIIFNSLVRALCKSGTIEHATMLVGKLSDMGCSPDAVTYNMLIKYHCSSGSIEEALQLYREMKNKGLCCQPNVVTYNTLIDCFCKSGSSEDVRKLLDEMSDHGILPSIVTFGTLMNCWCKEGRVDEACKLLSAMVDQNIEPSIVSFNMLIQGYCLVGQVECARELFDIMNTNGIGHDLYSYAILMMGYYQRQRIADVTCLLREMQCKGLIPDSFIARYCKTYLMPYL